MSILKRTIHAAIVSLALAGVALPAAAQSITDGYVFINGNYFKQSDGSGPYAISSAGVATLMSGGGGGGSGDASEATLSAVSSGVGATTDAAATAGGTGSLSAKLRLTTTLLNDGNAHLSRLTSSAGPNTAGPALSTTAFQIGGRYLTTPATMTNGEEAGITLTEDQQVRTADAAVLAAITDTNTQLPSALGPQTPANSLATFNAAATGAQTSVADAATDATCLAANAARKGATLYNDSTAAAYVLLANATSSATAYTVKLIADAYYEVPYSYTGVIKCIWASDASGSMRVTEITN